MEVTKQLLNDMVSTKMPYGQYQDTVICNLPVSYLDEFDKGGFPNGKLGILLQALHEMKTTGTDYILEPFKKKVSLI